MIITHPNRDKPVVQATRVTVVVLLLITVALMLVVMIGGWETLQGALPVQFGYVVAYLLLAFYAARWNRGVLPVSAALAVLLAIFAFVAGPGWFNRDETGFAHPKLPGGSEGLSAGLLGLLTLLIVPVQMLLVAFAMRGFSQGWNVEQERRDPAVRTGDYPDAPPYPA